MTLYEGEDMRWIGEDPPIARSVRDKMKRDEIQLSLYGKEIINQPKLGYFPYSKMKILYAFYLDVHDNGLSLVELKRKLDQEMSRNTLSEGLHFLRDHRLIQLVYKGVGPTKRRKYYKITEEGVSFWEKHGKVRKVQ